MKIWQTSQCICVSFWLNTSSHTGNNHNQWHLIHVMTCCNCFVFLKIKNHILLQLPLVSSTTVHYFLHFSECLSPRDIYITMFAFISSLEEKKNPFTLWLWATDTKADSCYWGFKSPKTLSAVKLNAAALSTKTSCYKSSSILKHMLRSEETVNALKQWTNNNTTFCTAFAEEVPHFSSLPRKKKTATKEKENELMNEWIYIAPFIHRMQQSAVQFSRTKAPRTQSLQLVGQNIPL